MKNLKRVLSLVLALVIITSVLASLDLTAFATDSVEPTESVTEVAPTEENTEQGTEKIEDETQPSTAAPTVETTEGETALPTDQTQPQTEPATQPVTDPQTQQPTVDPTKVDAVKNVKKVSGTTDSLKISWDAVEGAQGYRIFYKNNDVDKDFKPLVNTKGTQFTIKGLTHTTPYEFKISAFTIKLGKIYQSEAVIAKTGTNPAKTQKPYLKRCSTLIDISWNKNAKADGYYIYRQHAATNGKLVLYKTIKGNATTSFTDTKVDQGRAYNYQVRAYREMYKGITLTGEGETLRTLAGLCAPGLGSCTTQLRRVSFTWGKNAYAKGYDVMYSSSKSGPYTLIKSTSNTWLNTPRLTNNKKYYFRIIPYTVINNNKVYGTYLPVEKTVSSKAYGKNIGNTYIEISIKQQRMWYYIDGKLYVETPVVTGNYYGYSTPKGAYSIFQRMSPATLVGPSWCVNVNYWLAFTQSGCGIHDSTWRASSEYGGTTYIGNGSHGCVNTPLSKVKQIYSKAKIGTNVIVY